MKKLEDSESVINYICDIGNLDLEDYLFSRNVSGRLFRRLYKEKNIYVNGKFQRKSLELKKGDCITLVMEDEEDSTTPEKMNLNIIYEDYDLLIINKDPNMVVHPTKLHQMHTLSNGIAYYFKEKNIKKKIRFVNRLDMDTTGILIVAKNSFAHQQMALQFEDNTIEKKYLAIVQGIVEADEGTIDLPIGREEDKSIKKVIMENGQSALTKYKVLERFESASLVEVRIFTGRSHQIRVHMNYIGHPIIGDSLYNENSVLINRQALHSYYLKAIHPRFGSSLEFNAPLPEDMERLINLMRF